MHPRLPPLYLMDAILVSEMGVAWVPSVFEDLDTTGNSTITAKDANGYNVRITAAPDVPDGIFDDGNWYVIHGILKSLTLRVISKGQSVRGL